ncbi:S1C family serine protease [Paraoerskovia sediminicola]|uniref:S1C family serine protease n=1 Tax=Paraoerskovia sediminicola TaxID=1138587 RepID=UPI002572CC72|nr:serine protease [Paraoerskovia sediminicola]
MAHAAVALVLVAGTTAGCGVLPPLPDPVPAPSSLVPDEAATLLDGEPADATVDDTSLRPMAVRIRNVQCDGVSTGSGFALDARTLVTNRHVVESSRSLEIATYDGQDIEVEEILATDVADLALVRTTADLPAHPELADDDPEQGDDVTVVGYPEGGRLTLSRGTVLGTTDDPLYSNLGQVLLTDAEVEPGSSGSAALDDDAEVIGVVYAKADGGRSLLVPVSTLDSLLDDAGTFAPLDGCDGG